MNIRVLSLLKTQLVAADADEILAGQCARFLYRNIQLLLISTLVIACVTLYVFWNTADLVALMVWTMLIFFLTIMRVVLLFVYTHLKPPDSEAKRWLGYFTISAVISGALWSAALPLFFAGGSPLQKTYLTMMLLGMASGSMSMTAYWPPAYHNFTLPPMITLNVYMFMEGSTEWVGLAILEIAFLVGILRVGENHFRNFANTVRLQSENIELITKLREQKARAEQANQSKTQFLASASHDLRQPVHSLALFADALNPEVNTARGRTLMSNLARSVESIDELLSSLLDISKLDAGVVKVNAADIPLQPILHKIHNEFFNTAANRGLDFKIHNCNFAVKSDPVLLTNIVRNLVSNALRYTRYGGVLVGCRARSRKHGRDFVAIEVWDTGHGIPETEREKIFAEFYQLENPERDRGKGLGLGLAICQRLCGLLRHDLELNSRPGRGSVFRVYVPRAEAATTIAVRDSERETPPRPLENAVVLVVDDEKEILTAMQAVLQTWDCHVLTAGSKAEALAALDNSAHGEPNLIVCDYRLREGEIGSQVINAVQTHLDRKIPAIIMTGDTDPERLREAEASGHVLLHKPVRPAELHRMIQDIVSEKGA